MTQVNVNIRIGGLQKSSLIDYPGKISAIIFTQGCNFRCPYCHNPELISNILPRPLRERVGVRGILEFLKSRINKLDAVVITGGEPTLQKDLPEFIKQIKKMAFLVKLDTNGTNPKMLQKLLDEKLIDYVAMDIKAPIEKYSEAVKDKVSTKDILKSIEILKNSDIDYEFRTTVVKSQLLPEDFERIGKMIKDCEKYYLQRFIPSKTLDKSFLGQTTYSDEEFLSILETLKKYIKQVELR